MLKISQILALFCLIFLIQCGGRVPKAETAQSISNRFFKNYAKKYPTSIIGSSFIDNITINGVREESVNNALIEAIIHTESGRQVFVLLHSRKTPPLGWKVDSWEILGVR